MEKIIKQLVEIYQGYDHWDKNKLNEFCSIRYFRKLLSQGNIIYIKRNNKILAYMEVWILDIKQLLRLLEGSTFHPYTENIVDGTYAYVSDIYIKEKYRGLGIVSKLKRMGLIRLNRGNRLIGIVIQETKNKDRFRIFSLKGDNHGKIKSVRNDSSESNHYTNTYSRRN